MYKCRRVMLRHGRMFVLIVLTLSYMIGELTHFIVMITGSQLANDIEFGEGECSGNSFLSINSNFSEGITLELEALDHSASGSVDSGSIDSGSLGGDRPNEEENGLKKDFIFHPDLGTNTSLNSSFCFLLADYNRCTGVPSCTWRYTGSGLEYQLLVGPAYIIIFTISGVFMGILADRVSRPHLLCACVMTYSTCCALMGAAHSFPVLIVLRMGTAVGVSGCRPAAGSLIAEMFDARNRALANAVFSWGLYFGYGLSFLLGIYGSSLNLFGLGWRAAYILAGGLGLPVAALLLLVTEPRSKTEETPELNSTYSTRTPEIKPTFSSIHNLEQEMNITFSSLQNTVGCRERKLSHSIPGPSPGKDGTVSDVSSEYRRISSSEDSKASSLPISTGSGRLLGSTRRKSSLCSLQGVETKLRKLSTNSLQINPRKISFCLLEYPENRTDLKDRSQGLKGEDGEETNSKLNPEHISYFRSIIRCLSEPVLLLLFLTASLRHTAGYAWAHNNVNYFNQYHKGMDIGYWFMLCSILGGSSGVLVGGFISDAVVQKLGLSSRLWILSACTIISVPFSVLSLYLNPPHAFICLLLYYFFAETWFSLLFTVLVELVPVHIRSVSIGIFLFMMNCVGGNLPMLVDPISSYIGLQYTLYIAWPAVLATSGVLFFLSSIPLFKKRS